MSRNKMKKYNNFHYVCQVDTVYALFLYLILFSNQIEETFFVFGSGIPNLVKEQFGGNSFEIKKKQGNFFHNFLNILRGWFFLPLIYRRLNLSSKPSFGQDHLIFSRYVIAKSSSYTLLEDGIGNYTDVDGIVQFRKKYYFRWCFLSFFNLLKGVVNMPMGFHPQISSIYLTGMQNIPPYNKEKIIVFSITETWNKLSVDLQNRIKELLHSSQIFMVEEEYDLLLLTQCFSEEHQILEDEKIKMYQDILFSDGRDDKKICLKPHPREKTCYQDYFPNIKIIPSHIPFELLLLTSQVHIRSAITINSTAIYSLDEHVEKTILGIEYLKKYHI